MFAEALYGNKQLESQRPNLKLPIPEAWRVYRRRITAKWRKRSSYPLPTIGGKTLQWGKEEVITDTDWLAPFQTCSSHIKLFWVKVCLNIVTINMSDTQVSHNYTRGKQELLELGMILKNLNQSLFSSQDQIWILRPQNKFNNGSN